jgi:hypothetical protein
MVTPEIVTRLITVGIVMTVPLWPPSMIVVVAPAPSIVKLIPMVRFPA